MRSSYFGCAALAALVAACGCQASRVELPPPGALPLGLSGPHGSRTPQPPAAESSPEEGLPPAALGLTELREWVFALRPPRLAAAAHRYREALGRLGQAELPPNPTLMARKEMLEGAPSLGQGLTKIELSQRIELGGKRRARSAQAAAEAEVLLCDFQDQVRQGVRDAQVRFFALLGLQEQAALALEERRIAGELAELARTRHAAGRVTTQELRKFEVAAARARLAASSLERERERMCRNLEGALGLPAGHLREVQAAWPAISSLPAQETLQAGLNEHPRLAAAARALAAAGLALDRRRADAWPDLTLLLMGARDHDRDEDTYGFGFGLDLPIFDRNQGLREEALAGRLKAGALLEAERRLLAADLGEAAAEHQRNAVLLADHDREIAPAVAEAYELTELAYQSGRTTHLDVLDSLLLLVRARRERVAYQEGLAAAAVGLEYLSGIPLFPGP